MHRLFVIGALLVLCLTTAPDTVSAQLTHLEPGMRLRITAPSVGLRKERVRLLRASTETLFVAQMRGTNARPIATNALTSVDVSRGRSRGRGALRGAGLGFLAGSLIALATYESWCSACDEPYVSVVVGGGPGLIVGTTLGAAIGVERWQPVSVVSGQRRTPEVRFAVSIQP